MTLVASAGLAQTYKWTDENGQVHYTQVPPKTGKYENIGPAAPPASAPNQDALNKSLTDAQKAAPEQQKAAALEEQRRVQRQENCRAAIERLAYLDAQTPRRLGAKDEQGNVTRMTEQEFQKRRTAEDEKIKQNCD
jgi:hypothetical protein